MRMRFGCAQLALAGLLILSIVANANETKHVITYSDLMAFKRVGAPVVSPDGKWVIMSLREPGSEPNRFVSDLWVLAADGSSVPRRLTNSPESENDVTWAPDSRRIAYSSKGKGDEAEQVYLLDATGGDNPQRFTTLSTGARNPQWSPDGRAILFESMVYPGASDDDANRRIATEHREQKYKLRSYEGGPPRIWNAWLDDRRPTLFVQPVAPGAKAMDILSRTDLARTSGFWGINCCDDPTPKLRPIWSPDSREIVFNATAEFDDAAAGVDWVGYHLYRIGLVEGAEPEEITPTPGIYDHVKFAPDGAALYFTFSALNDEVYNLERLEAVSWPKPGAPRLVTQNFDRSIENFAVSADSGQIYLLTPESGRANLYRVAAAGGQPQRVIALSEGGYKDLVIPPHAARQELLALYGSAIHPPELVRIDPDARTHKNLSSVNTAAAATIDWRPLEHFYFESKSGDTIHSMIVYPPNFDPNKKYPMFSMIHGGADYYNEDQIFYRWNYHLLAAPGIVVLLTDYTGSSSFGEHFARALKNNPLKTAGEDINHAVEAAIERYPFIDGNRVCVGGASYGGALTNWLEATTTRYRCMISHAGMFDQALQWGEGDHQAYPDHLNGGPPWSLSPVYTDQNPLTNALRWKTPMLISAGEQDFRVPLGNAMLGYQTLRRMKVPTRLLIWPRAGHWIDNADDDERFYDEVRNWLKKYLLVQAPAAGHPQ